MYMKIRNNTTQYNIHISQAFGSKSIDSSAHDWDKFCGEKIPSSLELNLVIFDYISPQDKILDVGMGFGKTLFDLHKRGFKNLSGVDSNQSGIEFANNAIGKFNLDGNLNFVTGNAKELPFENSSQNAVVTQAFWTAIVNPSDRKAVVNEINRVLKNNGILYIADFGQTPEIPKYRERYEQGKQKGYEYGTFEVVNDSGEVEYLAHHHAKEELTKLLTESGFKIETYIVSPVQTRSGSTINGHTIIARKVD